GLRIVELPSDDHSENLLVRPSSAVPKGAAHYGSNDLGQTRPEIVLNPLGARDGTPPIQIVTHELLHTFGLNHDHDQDSIMSYRYRAREMTPTDIMALRVLYDSRMDGKIGWITQMTTARELIVEKLMQDGAPRETAEMGKTYLRDLVAVMKSLA